jgi:hypothetical protein
MQLDMYFDLVRFQEATVRQAVSLMDSLPGSKGRGKYNHLSFRKGQESWELDHPEDFFAGYADADSASLHYFVELKSTWNCSMWIHARSNGTSIGVGSESRNDINTVMNVFRSPREQAIVLPSPYPLDLSERKNDKKTAEFNIFIGHGRSEAWQQLNSHLRDKHELDVISYESGARAGHSIRDILDEMLVKSSLAFLVHTGEDETADERLRARQNVVHETGLFQGKLGFSRAIVLLEDGVEEFSNLAGIQYIPFQKGQIKSTFGDVLATVRREQKRKESA